MPDLRWQLALLLLLICVATHALPFPTNQSPTAAAQDAEVESEESRKVLGSSVVTSVSVIMDLGNGTKAYYADPMGRPVPKPTASAYVGSPPDLLHPDRYEFYTFDDSGDLVKKLMTLDEIHSIIAAGESGESPELRPNYYHSSLKSPSLLGEGATVEIMDDAVAEYSSPEMGVHQVIESVQNVLKGELEASKDKSPIQMDSMVKPGNESPEWSALIPGIHMSPDGSTIIEMVSSEIPVTMSNNMTLGSTSTTQGTVLPATNLLSTTQTHSSTSVASSQELPNTTTMKTTPHETSTTTTAAETPLPKKTTTVKPLLTSDIDVPSLSTTIRLPAVSGKQPTTIKKRPMTTMKTPVNTSEQPSKFTTLNVSTSQSLNATTSPPMLVGPTTETPNKYVQDNEINLAFPSNINSQSVLKDQLNISSSDDKHNSVLVTNNKPKIPMETVVSINEANVSRENLTLTENDVQKLDSPDNNASFSEIDKVINSSKDQISASMKPDIAEILNSYETNVSSLNDTQKHSILSNMSENSPFNISDYFNFNKTGNKPFNIFVNNPLNISNNYPFNVTGNNPFNISVNTPFNISSNYPFNFSSNNPLNMSGSYPFNISENNPLNISGFTPVNISGNYPFNINDINNLNISGNYPFNISDGSVLGNELVAQSQEASSNVLVTQNPSISPVPTPFATNSLSQPSPSSTVSTKATTQSPSALFTNLFELLSPGITKNLTSENETKSNFPQMTEVNTSIPSTVSPQIKPTTITEQTQSLTLQRDPLNEIMVGPNEEPITVKLPLKESHVINDTSNTIDSGSNKSSVVSVNKDILTTNVTDEYIVDKIPEASIQTVSVVSSAPVGSIKDVASSSESSVKVTVIKTSSTSTVSSSSGNTSSDENNQQVYEEMANKTSTHLSETKPNETIGVIKTDFGPLSSNITSSTVMGEKQESASQIFATVNNISAQSYQNNTVIHGINIETIGEQNMANGSSNISMQKEPVEVNLSTNISVINKTKVELNNSKESNSTKNHSSNSTMFDKTSPSVSQMESVTLKRPTGPDKYSNIEIVNGEMMGGDLKISQPSSSDISSVAASQVETVSVKTPLVQPDSYTNIGGSGGELMEGDLNAPPLPVQPDSYTNIGGLYGELMEGDLKAPAPALLPNIYTSIGVLNGEPMGGDLKVPQPLSSDISSVAASQVETVSVETPLVHPDSYTNNGSLGGEPLVADLKAPQSLGKPDGYDTIVNVIKDGVEVDTTVSSLKIYSAGNDGQASNKNKVVVKNEKEQATMNKNTTKHNLKESTSIMNESITHLLGQISMTQSDITEIVTEFAKINNPTYSSIDSTEYATLQFTHQDTSTDVSTDKTTIETVERLDVSTTSSPTTIVSLSSDMKFDKEDKRPLASSLSSVTTLEQAPNLFVSSDEGMNMSPELADSMSSMLSQIAEDSSTTILVANDGSLMEVTTYPSTTPDDGSETDDVDTNIRIIPITTSYKDGIKTNNVDTNIRIIPIDTSSKVGVETDNVNNNIRIIPIRGGSNYSAKDKFNTSVGIKLNLTHYNESVTNNGQTTLEIIPVTEAIITKAPSFEKGSTKDKIIFVSPLLASETNTMLEFSNADNSSLTMTEIVNKTELKEATSPFENQTENIQASKKINSSDDTINESSNITKPTDINFAQIGMGSDIKNLLSVGTLNMKGEQEEIAEENNIVTEKISKVTDPMAGEEIVSTETGYYSTNEVSTESLRTNVVSTELIDIPEGSTGRIEVTTELEETTKPRDTMLLDSLTQNNIHDSTTESVNDTQLMVADSSNEKGDASNFEKILLSPLSNVEPNTNYNNGKVTTELISKTTVLENKEGTTLAIPIQYEQDVTDKVPSASQTKATQVKYIEEEGGIIKKKLETTTDSFSSHISDEMSTQAWEKIFDSSNTNFKTESTLELEVTTKSYTEVNVTENETIPTIGTSINTGIDVDKLDEQSKEQPITTESYTESFAESISTKISVNQESDYKEDANQIAFSRKNSTILGITQAIFHTEESSTDSTTEATEKTKFTQLNDGITETSIIWNVTEEFEDNNSMGSTNFDDNNNTGVKSAISKSTEKTWTLVSTIAPPETKIGTVEFVASTATSLEVSTKTSTDIPSMNIESLKLSPLGITGRPIQDPSQGSLLDLYPAPQENTGLEASTLHLDKDVRDFSDLCNELAFRLWSAIASKGPASARSLVVSPFAVTSLLAMVFLGARGPTSGQMNDILRLDDMVTFNPHQVFRNVTESIVLAKNPGVVTAAFVRELYSDKAKGKLLDFYKERAQQFYDGHVEEVDFSNIGDVVRRRTNLLVKRQTFGKVPEYLRGSNLILRPPLAVFSANIFQTDCSQASTEGRDGEMYFTLLPATRQRRLVPIPAVVWRDGFLAGYDPVLDATAISLGGADTTVSTVMVLPGQQGQLASLEERLVDSPYAEGAWSRLLRTLHPRSGLELQLPRFSHRSQVNVTSALRRMGLRDLFAQGRADLKGLNGLSNDLHLADMVQVNTFSTCSEESRDSRRHVEVFPAATQRVGREEDDGELEGNEQDVVSIPLALRPRQARVPEGPRLRFDRPFLYLVRHNPTGLILHMGRFNPRLLR
uniref:(California timema) hypothetical protein n=1 Tax=Timema californicum TaxID=61474 RepID=A0A7R9J0V4_TIMCA|nr:unnamed protein product [Timema californicum]